MSKFLRVNIDNYLDAADKAAQWTDGRFTEEAKKTERARLTKPSREALEASIAVARRDADLETHEKALSTAILKALHDDSDSNRVLARELAWQRIAKRAERGEDLITLTRTASPVELEAIAAFAPAEMPHLKPNAAPRNHEQWQEHVEDIVVEVYATHPANADKFAPLVEKAAQAQQDVALADLGATLIEGLKPQSSVLNRVYQIDQDLYRRVTA